MSASLEKKQILLRNQHEAVQSFNRFHLRELEKLKDEVIERQRALRLNKAEMHKRDIEDITEPESWSSIQRPSTAQLQREVDELLAENPWRRAMMHQRMVYDHKGLVRPSMEYPSYSTRRYMP
ncbi:uncharacterized protein [Watersipora subatra]|uniref:uncharacterized protein n=1 Tax=Watersipora subatra TaxID=2589382 RepID=UPI00355B6943